MTAAQTQPRLTSINAATPCCRPQYTTACWPVSHLLSCKAADPELPDIPVGVGSAAPLGVLQLLQVVQGAGQPKGRAVEVSAPDVKGEQELAGKHELAAPAGKGVATDG